MTHIAHMNKDLSPRNFEIVNEIDGFEVKAFQKDLLDWYDRHQRELPWRARNFADTNPYHVWLSEVMLQQTTIATVKDYFLQFIDKWPTLKDFASASEDEVLAAWSGLGYYSRARNLYKAAQTLKTDFNHQLPDEQSELLKLSGIGDYTSAAITAIAFNKQATVMDGNIERVVSRIFKIEEKLPKAKPVYKEYTHYLAQDPMDRHSDYAQAMMDLGATICTPKNPKCMLCPVRSHCEAGQKGIAEAYPKKEAKKKKPKKYTNAYVLFDDKGRIFMRKRDEKGMLANLYEVPTSQWLQSKKEAKSDKLIDHNDLEEISGEVKHSFTHFDFFIKVYVGNFNDLELSLKELEQNSNDSRWIAQDDFEQFGIPTLVKKIIYHAVKG